MAKWILLMKTTRKLPVFFFTSFPYKLIQCMKKISQKEILKLHQAQINQYIKDKQP